MNNKKCGFISVLGITNVGKSTLINALVENKVSIVSRKVQTTRNRILGITTINDAQAIFIDTPGYFQAKRKFDKAMIRSSLTSVNDADITMLVVDAFKSNISKHMDFLQKLNFDNKPIILVINKIDLMDKELLLECVNGFKQHITIADCFFVSALKKQGLKEIKQYLQNNLPTDNWMYPSEQLTNVSLAMFASEITREAIYHYVHQELPYEIYVEPEQWEKRKNCIHILQSIHVNNEAQKKIILGKEGNKLKQIGTMARHNLEINLQNKFFLQLNVKISKNWMNKKKHYEEIGLTYSK